MRERVLAWLREWGAFVVVSALAVFSSASSFAAAGDWSSLGPSPAAYSFVGVSAPFGAEVALCPDGETSVNAACYVQASFEGADGTCSPADFGLDPAAYGPVPVCFSRLLPDPAAEPPVIGSVKLVCAPPLCMSSADGALISAAICAVWFTGLGIRMVIRTLRSDEERV